MSKINNEYFDKEKFKFKNLKSRKLIICQIIGGQVGLNIDKNITIKIKPFLR